MNAPEPIVSRQPLLELAALAKALGHPARLRILAMLRAGPLCVCQMTAVLELAFSTVSGHLNELRKSGLVLEQKRGKWVEYRAAEGDTVARLLDLLMPLLDGDPQVVEDAGLIAAVREVPLDSLCRSGLDLETLGLVRTSAASPAVLHVSRKGAEPSVGQPKRAIGVEEG